MKQRIDVDQLMSLSDEEKERLRELWEPKEYDVVLVEIYDDDTYWESSIVDIGSGTLTLSDIDEEYGGYEETTISKVLPLLSIGQMIKILDNIAYSFEIKIIDGDSIVSIIKGALSSKEYNFAKAELCDNLFEALKEVL